MEQLVNAACMSTRSLPRLKPPAVDEMDAGVCWQEATQGVTLHFLCHFVPLSSPALLVLAFFGGLFKARKSHSGARPIKKCFAE